MSKSSRKSGRGKVVITEHRGRGTKTVHKWKKCHVCGRDYNVIERMFKDIECPLCEISGATELIDDIADEGNSYCPGCGIGTDFGKHCDSCDPGDSGNGGGYGNWGNVREYE